MVHLIGNLTFHIQFYGAFCNPKNRPLWAVFEKINLFKCYIWDIIYIGNLILTSDHYMLKKTRIYGRRLFNPNL